MINQKNTDKIISNIPTSNNIIDYWEDIWDNFLESLNYKIHRLNWWKNIVIGNGLIANAFLWMNIDKKLIIFASGVSNSNEEDKACFEREKKLFSDINKSFNDFIFVYFSSCSIFDPELKNKPYIFHKKDMELLISKNIEHYCIIRLPIIVGSSNNPNTLTNYLHNNIINGNKFKVRKNAKRHLIDIDDVYMIVNKLLLNNLSKNKTIDIALYQYKITDIIGAFEDITWNKAIYDLIDQWWSYEINTKIIDILLPNIKSLSDKLYLYKIIEKYYSSL